MKTKRVFLFCFFVLENKKVNEREAGERVNPPWGPCASRGSPADPPREPGNEKEEQFFYF